MRNTRRVEPGSGFLDKKWVTYVLAFLLIILIFVLIISIRYQDEVINFFKDLFRRSKDQPPSSPFQNHIAILPLIPN